MIKESIQNIEVITKVFYCDRCGEEIKGCYTSKICSICKRNVCDNCGNYYDSEILIPGSFCGDQPGIACKECWKVGKPFIKKIKEKEEEYYNTKDRLIEEWKDKCKIGDD